MNVFVLMTLTYPELKNVCRVCLKKEELYDLYALQYGDISFKDLIENITGDVLIRDDEKPDKICNQCAVTLSNISQFLNAYKSTKNIYEEVIEKHWANADLAIRVNNQVPILPEDPLTINSLDIATKNQMEDISINQVLNSTRRHKLILPKIQPGCSYSENDPNFIQTQSVYNCLKCNSLPLRNFDEMLNHFHNKHRSSDNICILCNAKLTSGKFLHLVQDHRPKDKKFYCKRCFHLFSTKADLDRHKIDVPHNLRVYKCPCCLKSFFRKEFFEHFKPVKPRSKKTNLG